LLLGIGPKADGTLPEEVVVRLKSIGEWTSKNGKAIYGTRPTPVYNDGDIWFTQSKDGKKLYAVACLKEGEPMPETLVWKGNEPQKGSRMVYLPTGKSVKWERTPEGIRVTVPKGLPAQAALSFEFTPRRN
ncbi:hypothetical protein EZS27_039788, partial [termite gut metagenome]